MPIEQVIFFTYKKTLSALEHFRVYGPLMHARIKIINGFGGGQLNLEGVNSAQLVLFQRDFSKYFSAYLKVVKRAHELGKPIVLDLDDNLLALPRNHPDRKLTDLANGLVALLYGIMDADAVTVTTPVLKEALDQYNPNVYVLPNFLDDAIWNFRQPKMTSDKNQIKILFMGTPTHKPDLEMIVEPLVNLTRSYPESITFIFYGPEPPEKLAELGGTQYFPVKTYDYNAFVSDLQQIDADIAIAPLVDNFFNRCKSPIKYFEYSALGLPGVYSKLEPYTQMVEDGIDGFLADTLDDWEEKISLLIEDTSLRKDLAHKAQEKVRKNWIMRDHAQLWPDTYTRIIEQEFAEDAGKQSYLQALGSIASQLEEREIKQQSIEEELHQEILSVLSSNSWKITRPYRMVGRLLRRK